MQKSSLYSLIAACLMLDAIIANRALPRLRPAPLRLAPIERLPRQLGEWRCVGDIPLDERVRAVLPNARIVSRLYRSAAGERAQLLLETSPDPNEYHSPTVCLPGQGWNVVSSHPASVGAGSRVSATEMEVDLEGQRSTVLYWYTTDHQMDKWEALKARLLSGRPPTRLFVEIAVPAAPTIREAESAAHSLGTAVLPALVDLEK